MIQNQRLYQEIERKEKKEYLQKLTPHEAAVHLDELFEFARPFLSNLSRPMPIALALLLKKR